VCWSTLTMALVRVSLPHTVRVSSVRSYARTSVLGTFNVGPRTREAKGGSYFAQWALNRSMRLVVPDYLLPIPCHRKSFLLSMLHICSVRSVYHVNSIVTQTHAASFADLSAGLADTDMELFPTVQYGGFLGVAKTLAAFAITFTTSKLAT